MAQDNEIIAYLEMCQREGSSLQRGMNFQLGKSHSVILMSQRKNAPYVDRVEDDGFTVVYEGHDRQKSSDCQNPKHDDQPEFTPSGTLTENGKFHKAAQDFKKGLRLPENVKIYEKIHQGIWSYNGMFHLIDSWVEPAGDRNVFKFKLAAINDDNEGKNSDERDPDKLHRRVIPSQVKLEVWKRDQGCCTICKSTKDLHFDHIIPFSKGGSSTDSRNVQILCGKHNLQKHDKIE